MLMLIVYGTEIDPKSYQEKFSKRVFSHVNSEGMKPFLKLRNIFIRKFGYGCWKRDSNFDIKNHIRVFSPKEGRPFLVETDLQEVLASLTGDMSEEHPQWEEIIIQKFVYSKDVIIDDGLTTGGGEKIFQLKPSGKIRSAKILRCHQAYMEIVSSLVMIRTCMTEGSFETSLDPLRPIKVNPWERFIQLCTMVIFGTSTLVRYIYAEVNSDSRFILNRFSGRIIHCWSEPIKMNLLEKIQKARDCSQMEILAAAIGGAIRTVSEKFCTKPIWLIFPDSFEDSVLMGLSKIVVPYPSEGPMNRYGMVDVTINTEHLSSRLERLESVRERFVKQVQRSPLLKLNYWLMKYIGRFPSRVIQFALADSGAPVVFNHIPWIKSKLSLMGDELEEFAGWMPMLTRTGLGIVSARYCDSMRLCGVSETSRLSPEELQFMLNEIGKELVALAEECNIPIV
ncbi:unnamed protein product [Allacma fusca]|uniref:O-acyltransferase WSD1 C-terminal domain-containing protein n=1 Tax=Allacma fusca TaxID=39272 RepID=A0A8J2PUT2_9HEXA|nr:unnamed protein product [Allacma fusca]